MQEEMEFTRSILGITQILRKSSITETWEFTRSQKPDSLNPWIPLDLNEYNRIKKNIFWKKKFNKL